MMRFIVCALIVMMAGISSRAAAPATAPATKPALTENITDAKGLDYAIEKLKAPMRESDPLSAEEELKRFKPRAGLAVDLIAAEPTVRQPLCINFDERGRMWVVQYIQYPFPAGLRVVEYDKHIRAKFDKVPPAPPNHFAGRDVVSIFEDTKRDGSFSTVKAFVSGLSIATSALPGRGGRGADDYGVWVMNTPYLLFYPDKNRDDVPDADPIVHLSGFGLEDTHAVASNLTWGPDGWLYGTQGSTCTAKVKTLLGDTTKTTDFLGQAIWRYHPETHRFEIFAEGGGNTFGLEFDDAGRAFSGTNWGKFRGLHYVQGGYYVKGWGKHGPLTNPYAFGFFEHMPHTGNADRLSHTFIVYGGGLLGPEYTGKILSPNSLQSRLQVTRLEPEGSTFKTVEEPYLMTSDDGWFRPVDLKAGPDGALYVADMYEKRISHVDPRDTWDRKSGRIWRVRPADWKPATVAMDRLKGDVFGLTSQLESKNRWERSIARQVLTLRGFKGDGIDAAAYAWQTLKQVDQSALEALWLLHGLGRLDETLTVIALGNDNEHVRRWAIRLATDNRGATVPSTVFDRFQDLAGKEEDTEVRSQLASSAKRLAGEQAVPLIVRLLKHDSDAADVHIPMLLWWALEDKAVSHRSAVVEAMSEPDIWKHPMAKDVVLPRLARRYAADPSPENQAALVKLLQSAPDKSKQAALLAGVKEAFAGASPPRLSPELARVFGASGDVELALRNGDPAAEPGAIARAQDEKAAVAERVRLIEALGQSGKTSGPVLLKLAETSKQKEVRKAAIAALPHFESLELADGLAALYPKLAKDVDLRSVAVSALLARPAWSAALVRGVDAGRVAKADIGPVEVERLRQLEDPAVAALVVKHFGKAVRATNEEKAKEVERVKHLVTTGAGDAASGKVLYTARCAVCHTLFNEGGKVGPDLTSYDRRNANDMVINIVDPSAYIREEFAGFRVKTTGGDVYEGLIVERAGDRLTLADATGQKKTFARSEVADERALTLSLMPEGLLVGLSDQEVRDLFKYISGSAPPK